MEHDLWRALACGSEDRRPEKPPQGRDVGRVRPISAAFAAANKPIVAALVTTLAETGCRPSEALVLSWDAIDLDAGTISVWRAQEAIGFS